MSSRERLLLAVAISGLGVCHDRESDHATRSNKAGTSSRQQRRKFAVPCPSNAEMKKATRQSHRSTSGEQLTIYTYRASRMTELGVARGILTIGSVTNSSRRRRSKPASPSASIANQAAAESNEAYARDAALTLMISRHMTGIEASARRRRRHESGDHYAWMPG